MRTPGFSPVVPMIVIPALAGCAAARRAGPAGPSQHDVAALVRDLEARENEILAQLGPNSTATPVTTAPAAQPGSAETAGVVTSDEMEAPEEEDAEAETGADERSAGSACRVACRALASMERSTKRICELAGERDPRCIDARDRTSRSTARVARAGCRCDEE